MHPFLTPPQGLEWPIVFACRINEGECPLAVKSDEGLQEERRLLYVAVSPTTSLETPLS